ncbi:MAG: MBL fold metallo-hydrolase [Legionellaceae bacterium]|nr:MBL fold metallo-hydrolase [Legionellaceae bacterium]
MKLVFLGVSSALTTGYKNFQSNMLITSSSGRSLLIDCGTDIKHSLYDQKVSHSDIDAVYISHLHADHVGGLEWLGFSKLFIDQSRPSLYISRDQQQALWENVLKGGMSSLEDRSATLESYFNPQTIQDNAFIWEGHHFQLVKVFHSINNNKRIPCYGLMITGDHMQVFLSTDTRFSPEDLMPFYTKADIIFHDCEISKIPSNQHALYHDLKTLDNSIKEKMWLYDYANGRKPNAKKDGFKGYVVRGQSFDI